MQSTCFKSLQSAIVVDDAMQFNKLSNVQRQQTVVSGTEDVNAALRSLDAGAGRHLRDSQHGVCVCVYVCCKYSDDLARSAPTGSSNLDRMWICSGRRCYGNTGEWSVSCLRRPPYVQSESLKMQDHGYSADNIEYM